MRSARCSFLRGSGQGSVNWPLWEPARCWDRGPWARGADKEVKGTRSLMKTADPYSATRASSLEAGVVVTVNRLSSHCVVWEAGQVGAGGPEVQPAALGIKSGVQPAEGGTASPRSWWPRRSCQYLHTRRAPWRVRDCLPAGASHLRLVTSHSELLVCADSHCSGYYPGHRYRTYRTEGHHKEIC